MENNTKHAGFIAAPQQNTRKSHSANRNQQWPLTDYSCPKRGSTPALPLEANEKNCGWTCLISSSCFSRLLLGGGGVPDLICECISQFCLIELFVHGSLLCVVYLCSLVSHVLHLTSLPSHVACLTCHALFDLSMYNVLRCVFSYHAVL